MTAAIRQRSWRRGVNRCHQRYRRGGVLIIAVRCAWSVWAHCLHSSRSSTTRPRWSSSAIQRGIWSAERVGTYMAFTVWVWCVGSVIVVGVCGRVLGITSRWFGSRLGVSHPLRMVRGWEKTAIGALVGLFWGVGGERSGTASGCVWVRCVACWCTARAVGWWTTPRRCGCWRRCGANVARSPGCGVWRRCSTRGLSR